MVIGGAVAGTVVAAAKDDEFRDGVGNPFKSWGDALTS
jgi:hypothetical protein